jgi:hypothetical protein
VVQGFIRDKKFHPISTSKGKRLSRTALLGRDLRVGQDGDSIAKLLNARVKQFASDRAHMYGRIREGQEDQRKFQRDRNIKLRPKIIRQFRLARSQNILKPKELEQFLLAKIPELGSDRQSIQFVTNVIQEFLNREKDFEKKIKDKTTSEQAELRTAFKDAETDTDDSIKKELKSSDKQFNKNQDKKVKDLQNKIDKFRNKEKDLKESEKKEEKADTPKEKKEAKEDVKDDTKSAENAEQEIIDALKKTKKIEVETPFPSEII